MKILFADDDEMALFKWTDILTRSGFDVLTARNGTEALKIMSSESAPKLLLLDWKMPGIEGIEICREIRKFRSSVVPYIIMVTAKDEKEDIIKGLRAGADDYVVKPFDMDILKVRIEAGKRVLDLQQALAERIEELQHSIKHIERLQGILPICVYCKKIHDSQERWEQIDKYISEHSEAKFSHGICPDCERDHFGDED